MKRLAKAGILILVIGLSFLAGTLYRSTSEGDGFSTGDMFGLTSETWGTVANSYFLAPRDYRMEVKANMTIDVYVLDSEGVRLWRAESKLEPVRSFEGVKQQVVTFHLDNRGDYALLVHNPSGEAAGYELSVSGYGIETDLLYTALTIIALGAVITIASFIPRGSSGRKQSSAKKSTALPAAILAFLILSVPIASCTAQSSSILAPAWMKEDTYVIYDTSPGIGYINGVPETSTYMTFLNGTSLKYNNVTSAFFRWECIHLSGDIATLNVSYTITSDLPSDNFYTSALVDVNIASRSVYLQNGTLIGTTDLWLPSSPAEGQEVVLWDMPPDRVTANVTTKMFNGENMFTGQTSQGTQRIFQLQNVLGKINGVDVDLGTFGGSGMYEYDTGLMLGDSLRYEPMLTALGISLYDPALSMTTNVDMGPAQVFINWSYVLGLAAIVGSIVIVAVLMFKRSRQRR